MSQKLNIRLAARCEAAGRSENEDNFHVVDDLSVSNARFLTDKVLPLGDKGALLLVCDGMGGMNAGEVASAIGVQTIEQLFSPQYLTDEVLANDESVCAYMKQTIIKADRCIKEEAQRDSEKAGMGSTAVMAWLLKNKVYVAWCGDSRCYRYNPTTGLEQLSHDHSYVQELVDTGALDPSLAFDHPNKNIITRSLGDPRGSARPDAKVYDLNVGDVILLCSDGLSDSLRDNEIEQSISQSLSSMEKCRDALWNDSRAAGWHDNVTIILAQVSEGGSTPTGPNSGGSKEPGTKKPKEPGTKKLWVIVSSIIILLLIVFCVILYFKYKPGDQFQNTKDTTETKEGKGSEKRRIEPVEVEKYSSYPDIDYDILKDTIESDIRKCVDDTLIENAYEYLCSIQEALKTYDDQIKSDNMIAEKNKNDWKNFYKSICEEICEEIEKLKK